MRKLLASAVVLGALTAPLWSDAAVAADRRVALVVGNSAYQNAPRLPNPARDARSVAEMFKEAGFDVISQHNDVGSLDFKRAIRQFEDAAAEADIAVVYYAGHGIEIRGTNYLVPVDAKLASDRDADDEAITLNRLIESVDGAKRLRLVILDACRDNPFLRTMRRQRAAAVRAISAGLGKVELTTTDTLIAYAAREGSTAEDGEGDHSPFTRAVLNNLTVPGLDIRLAFGRIRDEVLKTTGNRQEPYVYGSLGGGTVSLVPPPPEPVAASIDPRLVQVDYQLVEKLDSRVAWESFLVQHPTGFYSDLARQQLAKLEPSDRTGSQPRNPPGGPAPTSLPNQPPPAPKAPTSVEQRAWDRIKDKSNLAALREFIRLYPTSVLANTARTRVEALEIAASDREERARADREAKAAEAKRLEAERAAARQREAEQARKEREAKIAETARQEAERAAARQRAELERADREAKAAEAARLEAQRMARGRQELERTEQVAKAAEAARQEAERAATRQRQELERAEQGAKVAEAARLEAERAAARQRDEVARAEQDSKVAEAARQEAQVPTVLAAVPGQTSRNAPAVNVEPLNRVSNTPELVRSAQKELVRVGCYAGSIDGKLLSTTRAAVTRYQSELGEPAAAVEITDDFVAKLKDHVGRVCPLVCPTGKIAEGEKCVPSRIAVPSVRQKDLDDEKAGRRQKSKEQASRRKQDTDYEKPVRRARQEEPKQRPVAARPEPRPRQEAPRPRQEAAVPHHQSSPRAGGATIGVGF